jgi:hypothetical protein
MRSETMYEFTDEDLKFNQLGQLSPSQQQWLKNIGKGAVRLQGFNVWIAVGFMFLGLCITLGLYMSNEESRAALFANSSNLLLFPVTIIVVIGILVLSILLARWNANKLQSAVLSSVSGNLRFDREYSSEGNLATYYVIVCKKKFKFADDMSGILKEGQRYKFYYCNSEMYEFVMSYESLPM